MVYKYHSLYLRVADPNPLFMWKLGSRSGFIGKPGSGFTKESYPNPIPDFSKRKVLIVVVYITKISVHYLLLIFFFLQSALDFSTHISTNVGTFRYIKNLTASANSVARNRYEERVIGHPVQYRYFIIYIEVQKLKHYNCCLFLSQFYQCSQDDMGLEVHTCLYIY